MKTQVAEFFSNMAIFTHIFASDLISFYYLGAQLSISKNKLNQARRNISRFCLFNVIIAHLAHQAISLTHPTFTRTAVG